MGILDWVFRREPVAAGPPIAFFVRLDDNDWDSDQGAWRCPALRIPSAEVTELRSSGDSIAPKKYSVDSRAHLIFWIAPDRPKSVSVRLEVSPSLVTKDTANAERKDTATRVAIITAVAGVIGATITAAGGYAAAVKRFREDPSPVRSGPPEFGGTGGASGGASAGDPRCARHNAKAAAFKNGVCVLECQENYRDCNKKGSDGCETDVTTDTRNCGECGKGCGEKTLCVRGVCQEAVLPTAVLPRPGRFEGLAVALVDAPDGGGTSKVTRLMFVDRDRGTIAGAYPASLSRGVTLLADNQPDTWGVAAGKQAVFWTRPYTLKDAGNPLPDTGTISARTFASDGSPTGEVKVIRQSLSFPTDLALSDDEQWLVWTALAGENPGGEVWSHRVGTPNPTRVATSEAGASPSGITTNGNRAFWATCRGRGTGKSGGDIWSVTRGDAEGFGEPQRHKLATLDDCRITTSDAPNSDRRDERPRRGPIVPWLQLRADSTNLYWLGPQHVMKLAQKNGEPEALCPTKDTDPRAIALDETHVYWGTRSGEVLRVRKASEREASIEVLARNSTGAAIANVAVDDSNVYWVEDESKEGAKDGRIMQAPKQPRR